MNKQIDFLLRAVETLSKDNYRYFEFPRTASSSGERGFPDGMQICVKDEIYIISGIGLNDIINSHFSIRFFGNETIRFKCDENGITFKTDYDGVVAERVFGKGTTADEVVSVAICGLHICLVQESLKLNQLEVEAERFLAR